MRPDKVIPLLAAALDEVAELFDAIGAKLEDERWQNAAIVVNRAVDELRKRAPADEARYQMILACEARELEQQLADAKRTITNMLPRKPMVRVTVAAFAAAKARVVRAIRATRATRRGASLNGRYFDGLKFPGDIGRR